MAATPPETTESTSTIAISGLVIVLAIIFTALRFYTRISTRSGLGWDDWLLFCSVIATLATAVLVLVASAINPHGTWIAEARDPTYVFQDIDVRYVKLTFAASVLYFTIAGSTKMSILLMYNRLFSINKPFRRQLYLVSFLVMGWWIGCTMATVLNCIPLKYTWINGLDDPRYCFNFNIFWMAEGAVEVVIDALVLSLPIKTVSRLHLSWRKKATVAFIFLLGGFVVISGIIRTVLGYAPDGRREPLYSKVEVWTLVHTSLAIVGACLPVLMPLAATVKRVIGTPAKKYLYSWFSASRSYIETKTGKKRSSAGTGELTSATSPDGKQVVFLRTEIKVESQPVNSLGTTRFYSNV